MLKCTKKADVAKRPQAFLHVGLLINKHAGEANLLFDMSSGIFQTTASCESELAWDAANALNDTIFAILDNGGEDLQKSCISCGIRSAGYLMDVLTGR